MTAVSQRPAGRRAGFTLTELMISSAISVLVVGALTVAMAHFQRASRRESQIMDMQQNAARLVEAVSRDVRQAGYGLPLTNSVISQWVTWVGGMTNSIVIQQGASANDPDTLSVIRAEPVGAQTAATSAYGAVTLTLNSGAGSSFNSSSRKLAFIGRLELARVVSVFGDTLTVSKHPTLSGYGLTNAYPVGTPVELVKVITYSSDLTAGTSEQMYFIVRDDHVSGGTALEKAAAVWIENFQAERDGNAVTFTVTSRASQGDPGFVDATGTGNVRRLSMNARVGSRNAAGGGP